MAARLRPRAERGRIQRDPLVFGTSRLGAPLHWWEAERTDPPGPTLLVLAGQHGDEGEGVAVLSAAFRSLAAGTRGAHVVLALNPDGLARGTRANARGVDLNRNLPTRDWSAEPVHHRWTLDDPRDVVLGAGDGPGSEPETRALVDLVLRLRVNTVVSVHAPLGLVDDPGETETGRWIAERTALPRVPDVGYPTPGSFGTWGGERGLDVITLELPAVDRERLVATYAPVLAELLGRVGLPRPA